MSNLGPSQDRPALARQAPHEVPAWLRGIYAGLCLYLFLAALNVLGAGLGTFGSDSDVLTRAFAYGQNPFIALMAGVLVTMVVQSSSFTSALIVTLVASGEMTLGTAVFAIMGANIGTAVTGVIVALANVRIKRNFRRSFTAALMHDLFNILTVLLIFPVEWLTGMFHERGYGIFTRLAAWLADLIGLEEVARPNSPIKTITAPVVDAANWLGAALMPTTAAAGLMVAGIGLLLMFAALVFMVQNLLLPYRCAGLRRGRDLDRAGAVQLDHQQPDGAAGGGRGGAPAPCAAVHDGGQPGYHRDQPTGGDRQPDCGGDDGGAVSRYLQPYRHRDLVAAAGHSVAHCHLVWTPGRAAHSLCVPVPDRCVPDRAAGGHHADRILYPPALSAAS